MNHRLLVIGSRDYKKSTVKMLIEEAEKLFEKVLFVPINKLRIVSENSETRLFYKGRNLLEFDVCYPRISARDYLFGEAVLKVLENSNVYIPTPLRAYQVTNHKFYTVKELANEKIPVIRSTLFISPEAAKQTLRDFGLPLVIKMISGFAGKGVVLIETEQQLNSILDAVKIFDEFISAQKFIKGKNTDIRCYVIGEKVITVRRTGKRGEWRANVSRGGTAQEIPTTNEMKEIALKSAKALGLGICAVDLMETKKGLAVIEINFMPGPFKAFLGNKIPREMVRFLHAKASERKASQSL